MSEKILNLQGKEVKEFLKYDSRILTKEEKQSLETARQYYKAKCKQ